ncbi:immunity 26/phosphotriesterase HocA family protein [Parachryseolinea silvisoli]|uniref:immunity 26/phosphotriesterase HocA family protein n=1 Tax=Parachryseolinea silvisoli TaxID=2873601 RepID=UPI002265DEA9|nr:immunity 26/phosphotriesterase HocA family protein [Parachryseolinea silvisoli]MCD9018422.1 immunity 26/phosphotriesterase HocA family protein [Parachryseolinea silvisoli]
MKRLVQGSVVSIPLFGNLGYAYAKYIDLSKIDSKISVPDIIKVYNFHLREVDVDLVALASSKYLLSPMIVAGLRPTLREGKWLNIGNVDVDNFDLELPDFKDGNTTYDEIAKQEWFIVRDASLVKRERSTYDKVKYLQPYVGLGTGTIEIRLSMYVILRRKENVEDYFDLNDERYKWNYMQVIDSPALV